MIEKDTLDRAISEAHRFISAAGDLKYYYREEKHNTIAHAACKRASMDLSRALADLRQSR